MDTNILFIRIQLYDWSTKYWMYIMANVNLIIKFDVFGYSIRIFEI